MTPIEDVISNQALIVSAILAVVIIIVGAIIRSNEESKERATAYYDYAKSCYPDPWEEGISEEEAERRYNRPPGRQHVSAKEFYDGLP
jgi:hypothetical protein